MLLDFWPPDDEECWSDAASPRFYPAFAWTLFLAVVNVEEQIPRFIEQSRIKRIPSGHDVESVRAVALPVMLALIVIRVWVRGA